MKTTLTVLAFGASLMLTACASTPSADHIGNGEYGIAVYPGHLPGVEDSEPAEFGKQQGEQLVYLDRSCREQMASQVPSAVKSVGATALRTAIPTAILGGLGTGMGIKSVAAGAKGYTSYGMWANGGSAAGAGIGGGIDRHLTGNRYTQAGCMNAMVTDAKARDGALKGIHVIFNADAVNGRPLKVPTNQSSTASVHGKPDQNAQPDAVPPHP